MGEEILSEGQLSCIMMWLKAMVLQSVVAKEKLRPLTEKKISLSFLTSSIHLFKIFFSAVAELGFYLEKHFLTYIEGNSQESYTSTT